MNRNKRGIESQDKPLGQLWSYSITKLMSEDLLRNEEKERGELSLLKDKLTQWRPDMSGINDEQTSIDENRNRHRKTFVGCPNLLCLATLGESRSTIGVPRVIIFWATWVDFDELRRYKFTCRPNHGRVRSERIVKWELELSFIGAYQTPLSSESRPDTTTVASVSPESQFSVASSPAGTSLFFEACPLLPRGVPFPFTLKPYFCWSRMSRIRHAALVTPRDLEAVSWSTCGEVSVSIIFSPAVIYKVADNQPLYFREW